MRHKRIVVLILLSMLTLASGCTPVVRKTPDTIVIPGQERKYAGALELLRAGNEQGARILLEQVCEAPPLSGVTDEAIFRLALLYLRDDGGKGVMRSQELLERLKKEFPRSLWTHQAAPLASYLVGVKNFRDSDKDKDRDRDRELKALRELNLSISRDNKELRQSIERLKSLDMELEQKIKR